MNRLGFLNKRFHFRFDEEYTCFRKLRGSLINLAIKKSPSPSPTSIVNDFLFSPYRRTLLIEKVGAVLYFVRNTWSITMTANLFGSHQCTLAKVVKKVPSVIVTYVVPKFIELPNSQDEMLSKISVWSKVWNDKSIRMYKWYSNFLKSTHSKLSRLL